MSRGCFKSNKIKLAVKTVIIATVNVNHDFGGSETRVYILVSKRI